MSLIIDLTLVSISVRFSWSHFEFFGLLWLSHHQEYKRLHSDCDKVSMAKMVLIWQKLDDISVILNWDSSVLFCHFLYQKKVWRFESTKPHNHKIWHWDYNDHARKMQQTKKLFATPFSQSPRQIVLMGEELINRGYCWLLLFIVARRRKLDKWLSSVSKFM